MNDHSRRSFLKRSLQAGAASLALGTPFLAAGCATPSSSPSDAPAVHTRKKFQWKLLTTWPPSFPVIQDGPKLLAKWVNEMSNGQLDIQVYGGGNLFLLLKHSMRSVRAQQRWAMGHLITGQEKYPPHNFLPLSRSV